MTNVRGRMWNEINANPFDYFARARRDEFEDRVEDLYAKGGGGV